MFEWQQVSSSLQDSFRILAVLNNAVVWMDSTRPANSKSASLFNNPFVTVPKVPIKVGIIVTFMSHSFFHSLARSKYLSFFHILSVLFCGQPVQQSRQFCKLSFFCWFLLGLGVWSRLGDPSVCQSPKGVYVRHSLGQMLGLHILFARWVKFKFLAHLPVAHLAHPVASSLILLLC